MLLAAGAIILLLIYYFDRRSHAARKRDIFGDTREHESDVLLDGDLDQGLNDQFDIPGETSLSDMHTQELDSLAEELSGHIDPSLPEYSAAATEVEQSQPLSSEGYESLEVEVEGVEEAAEDVNELETIDNPEPVQENNSSSVAEISTVIVMYVVAADDKPFSGRAILKAFHAHKLRFGELDVFHRILGVGATAHTIFSVSNMLNPGTLIPDDLAHAEVKGLSFFMKLPGPVDPTGAFDDMLHCARHIASTLQGTVKDEALTEITQEKITQQRTQIKRSFA
jgi:cell division protein ZipA